MKLYFSPMACSLASRITLYESGADADYVEVDPKAKTTPDGTDYRTIHSLGLVPALRLDDGDLLTENAAILQYLADRFPHAGLAPTDPIGRSRLQQWLSFIGTELHKAVYVPLLDKTASDGARAYALGKVDARLGWLASRLEGRDVLLDRFSVADAYLFTVLTWSAVTPIQLQKWPALAAYLRRVLARPLVARAVAEEKDLYMKELARHNTPIDAQTAAALRAS